MISDTLISPRVDNYIRKRSVDYKRRSGRTNFRDILRKRFREDVKNKRGAVVNQLRTLESEETVRSALSRLIEDDLRKLQLTVTSHDGFVEEMEFTENETHHPISLTEKEQWIVEEYERLLSETMQLMDMEDAVVCPVCERGVLHSAGAGVGVVACSQCSLRLPTTTPLTHIQTLLFNAVEGHGEGCGEKPQFIICPDNNTSNLIMLCARCDHVQQVI